MALALSPTGRIAAARALRRVAFLPGSYRLQRRLASPAVTAANAQVVDAPYPIAPRFVADPAPLWRSSTDSFIGWNAWFRGVYEIETLAVLRTYLEPGMKVIEVGANEGYHTLFAAWCVGGEGHVTTYEPSPYALARLRDNVARAGWQARVAIRPVAVADATGRMKFFVPAPTAENQGVGGFDADRETPTVATEVDVVRLDAEAFTDCDLIKMDVQGAEGRVLTGAAALIDRRSPRVYFEVESNESGETAGLVWLRERGYQLWRVRRRRTAPFFDLEAPPRLRWNGNCLAIRPNR